MALLEKLHRRIVDMGLVPRIITLLPVISTLCALFGFISITILPMDGQYRRTYISENALMPSQAYSYFRESEWNILRGYRSQIEEMVNMTSTERNHLMGSWLQEFGTKTAVYENEQYGETLYGVMHAPRGDGTEAMVLAIPWFNSDDEFNIGGAALGVSLARFFSRWPVWSKNIIVVFSENPRAALRSWVEAYHTSLDLTGGSIEAAVVLDYSSAEDFFEYVEISYDGLNGELPNLDLVNVAISVTEHEGIKVSLHGLPDDQITDNDYWSRLKILLLGIRDWALSGVKNPHGNEAFSGWRIQSVTLKAHGHSGHDITTFGRIPEAMFRSINNLLEKFHQSFFFYLLLAPRQFVSISSYLPSAVVLSVAFVISSLNAFINNDYAKITFFSEYNLVALMVWFISLVISFIISQVFLLVPSAVLLMTISLASCFLPLVLSEKVHISEPLSYRLKNVAFLYFSLVSTSLLMINFAMALLIGTLAFPMTFIKTIVVEGPTEHEMHTKLPNSVKIEPEDEIELIKHQEVIVSEKTQQKLKLKNLLLLILTNPFVSITLFGLFFDNEFNGFDIINKLVSAWLDLKCWSWFILCIGWLPCWLLVLASSFGSKSVVMKSKEKQN
ncbi:gaa1p [Saccharomyces arboricola H-6]|uniref:Gaa1p n=1 Tax=Saccharomyces arboricola (strain H-6 / AS 2.3317 / CBS 10644) TaxID=1160507 RepID=J8PKU7_SACAR|nr:gaa1p [Saccharomyces arboricola H-6]